jgi:uncharacterized protein YdeI (YjbR/CyaY-like superfamily)
MASLSDLPRLDFAGAGAWEAWLEENHSSHEGLWVVMAKRGSSIEGVHYPEALETAICFGWIDGRRKALDEFRFLQLFTPRRARSRWSQINRDKAEALIAEGRMREAGRAEVRRAKEDGRWEAAYEGQASAVVPEDLRRELKERPAAAAFFAGLSAQNRYAFIYRLNDAKRPETRARKLERFVAMLEAGESFHP